MKHLFFAVTLMCVLLFCIPFSHITCSDDDDDPTPTPTSTPTPVLVAISGTVYCGGYTPQSNIRIICEEQETSTDAFGHYSLSNLPAGKKMVHAIWDMGGFKFIQTAVADADRFDFLFLNIMYYSGQFGTVKGNVDGMSSNFFDRISYIEVIAVPIEGIMCSDYLIDGDTNFFIDGASVGNNALLAAEYDFDLDCYTNFGLVTDVIVNENETSNQDIYLDDSGFEQATGTFPTSYYTYGGYVKSYLNFDSLPFFRYCLSGGDITTGQYNFYGGGNGSFEYDVIPAFYGGQKGTQVSVSRDTDIFRLFTCSKNTHGSNECFFSEELDWLHVSSPKPMSSNVGSYPLFQWSGDGQVYNIEMYGYNASDYLSWSIFTSDTEFQTPELPEFDLIRFDEVYAYIRTKSTWEADFTTITPPLPNDMDFIGKELIFWFYPGDQPTSPHLTPEKVKRAHEADFKQRRVPKKTPDGRYLYWPPVFADQSVSLF